MISKLADVRITGSQYGNLFAKGRPKFIVVHCTQSPLKDGQAAFRMQLLANRGDASAHYLVDPGTIAAGVDEKYIAWGAGTVNSSAIHIEFVGYAYYTRRDWTTPDGIAMLKRGAALIADIAKRHGIPLRLLGTAELKSAWKNGGTGGVVTHAQCTTAIGGTTHTDPGTGFPLDLLMEYTKDDDDMPTAREVVDELLDKTTITVRDAAQGVNGSVQNYTVRELLARLGRLTSLTQDAVRDGKLSK